MRREFLIEKIAEKIGPAYTKTDIEKLIDTFLDTLFDILIENKRVELRRFGTFELRRRPVEARGLLRVVKYTLWRIATYPFSVLQRFLRIWFRRKPRPTNVR